MVKLKESLGNIKLRVRAAAERAGRSADEIEIVVVTKQVGLETIKILSDLNWEDIGENRVNDALEKSTSLSGNLFTWHMIGHLQTNKVKKAVSLFEYIHSLDNLYLADIIQKEAEKAGKFIKVFIQVNISGEATKQGIHPAELVAFYKEARQITTRNSQFVQPNELDKGKKGGMKVVGLMTMAPLADNPEETRPYFRRLKELLDDLKGKFANIDNANDLKYLSMGMSQDFEIAVEEGANLLRIGSAIFNS
ncbi:MAG: YggS family pyridoxal phosphate-dependent enzyme [Planctomycetota bacterium]